LPDCDAYVGGVRAAVGERSVHPRIDRFADEVQAAARVLNRVGIGGVHDDRDADANRAIRGHRGPQPLDRVGPDLDVGIHQEHIRLSRIADPDVPSGVGPVVVRKRPHADVRISGVQPVGRAVGAASVDDEQPASGASGRIQGGNGCAERLSIVVAGDGDADVLGKGGRHENQ